MAVTDDAVWVTSASVNHVVRLDEKQTSPPATVTIKKPCSGLAAGFGSIWAPSCGAHSLVRVDAGTGKDSGEDSRRHPQILKVESRWAPEACGWPSDKKGARAESIRRTIKSWRS